MVSPGTGGEEYTVWRVRNRTAQGLLDFIDGYVAAINGGGSPVGGSTGG